MKTVVISGATSFIGYNLVKRLIGNNFNIISIVRPNCKKKDIIQNLKKYTKYIELDLNDYDKLGNYIRHCDIYFPLTWDGTKREDRDNSEKNRRSKEMLFESVKSIVNLCNCNKIISAGSQSVYGYHLEKISENTICNPDTEYGKNKLEFYYELEQYCSNKSINYIEARLFSVYGLGDSDEKMVSQLIYKLLRNYDISLTKCNQVWSFLHIEDAIDAIILLMNDKIKNGYYNLGSGENRELRYFIEKMHLLTKSKSRLKFGEIPYSNGIIPNVDYDISKIMKETGWFPKIEFENGIKEMINYLQTNYD